MLCSPEDNEPSLFTLKPIKPQRTYDLDAHKSRPSHAVAPTFIFDPVVLDGEYDHNLLDQYRIPPQDSLAWGGGVGCTVGDWVGSMDGVSVGHGMGCILG